MSIIDDLKAHWSSMSDAEKQDALNMLGEVIGGTAGAAAGGPTPLAILGAGAGATAGNSAAHLLGKALGLKTIQMTPEETAKDVGMTFLGNAVGEGAGRAVAPLYRGTKNLTARAIRSAVHADPEVVNLARQAGIQLTPGMAASAKAEGGRPLAPIIESGLEKTIGGTGPIRSKTMQAVQKWEGNTRQIPAQFHPQPVPATEAGNAAVDQLAANRGASASNFRPQYAGINSRAGNVPIDFSIARDDARSFLSELPQGMESYFPSGVMRKLKSVAGMADGQLVRPNSLVDSGLPQMTFEEAQHLRTGLLEAERAMKTGDAAVQRRAIPALRKAVDASIEDSLTNSTDPAARQALGDWRAVNSEYADASSKLYNGGKTGNPVTSMIERAESAGKPEALPAQLAQHPTAIANTERAVSPMYEAADNQVMPKLRRNVADTMLDDSLTQNRFIGDERFINPRRMEKALDVNKDAYNALFGEGPYQQLRDASELGKAITRPTSLTNTSETARYSNLLKYGGMVPGAIIGAATGDDPAEKLRDAAGGMAAGVVIPRLAAKAWTGPMSRAVMGEAVKEPPKLLSPLASAIGRTYAAQKLTQPPKLQRPDDLPDDFLIDRARLASSGPDDLPDEFLAKPRKQ